MSGWSTRKPRRKSAYQIVGVHEADIKDGKLSISSPLAKALIGKKVGDTVSVPAPGGDRSYEILGVKFMLSVLRFADVTGRRPSGSPAVSLRTPALPSDAVSRATGAEVVLKLDNLQAIGAFKERGAANRLALLTDRERERGVIAMSAGNHAQAVARHARLSIRRHHRDAKIHAGHESDAHRGLGRQGRAARRNAGRSRRARARTGGRTRPGLRPSL